MDAMDNNSVWCVTVNEHTVRCEGEEYISESLYQPDGWPFWVILIMYMVLVLFAGSYLHSHPLDPPVCANHGLV